MALPTQRTNLATNPNILGTNGINTIRTNLITNPSFETGTTGVVPGTAVTVSTTTFASAVYVGTQALNIAIGAGATTFCYLYQSVTATAGQYMSFAANVRWSSGSRYVRQKIDFRDSGGTLIGAAVSGAIWSASSGTGGGSRATLNALAPTGTVTARLYLYFYDDAAGAVAPLNGSILASDGWHAAEAATAVDADWRTAAYFDGATAAAGDFTYAWTGTAHASTSNERGTIAALCATASGTGGVGATFQSADAPPGSTKSSKTLWTQANTSGSTGMTYTTQISGVAGDVVSASCWVKCDVARNIKLLLRPRNVSTSVVTDPTTATTVPANTWTKLSTEGLVTSGTYTNIQVFPWAVTGDTTFSAGESIQLAQVVIERNGTGTVGPYFDGSTVDPNYTNAWTGTVDASTSTSDVYGLWAEQITGPGAPKVQVTAIGLGGVNTVTQVTRQCGREVWSVPGWKKRNSLSADTYTDATPPLGRPVTYTLIKDGLPVNSRTITVESTTGWVQDPLSPETALPVATTDADPAVLALAKAALKNITYVAQYEEETPLGGQYPIIRADQRGGASGVEFHLNAYQNTISDAFQQLVLDTPILLFRGLPSWGSIPALAYLIGNVQEAPYNRDRGGQFTTWAAGGKLASPVALGPLTGTVTNAMVQDNLVGRTNASIQSTTGTKRNIVVQADPLSLGQ